MYFRAALRPVRAGVHRLYEQAFGTHLFSYLPTALANASLAPTDLERLQVLKLRSLLEVAWERSPFYRERMSQAGIRVEEIRATTDIARLPPVTKSELRVALADGSLLTQPKDGLPKGQTGRSTGQPLVFYHYPPGRAFARACELRAFMQWGWRLGDSIVTVWGAHMNVPSTLSMIRRFRNSILGQLIPHQRTCVHCSPMVYLYTSPASSPSF